MKKLLVLAMLFGSAVHAQTPLSGIQVRQITATTTGTSAWALADSAAALQASTPVDCATVLINTSATAVFVGGSDVTQDLTKAVSICSSGCTSSAPLSIQASPKAVFVRTASGTQALQVIIGGGCR